MIFCLDVDDTITQWNSDRDYVNFKPIPGMVEAVNKLYDEGHTIKLFTSRGMQSVGPGNIEEMILPSLQENLDKIGLKYHELITHKPVYDMIVDDKAVDPHTFIELCKTQAIDDIILEIEEEK